MTIAAVVLAAGESTRFGAPKQRLLLPAVLDRLAGSEVEEIVVVEGAYELALPSNAMSQGVRLVSCDAWELGPGASLRCGLAALGPEVEAAVVVLADGPNLQPAEIARVLDVWRAEDGIVAASYAGARGHPLVLGRETWNDVPDEGLHTRLVRLVPCEDLGEPGDVDTPDDLPPDFEVG